MTKLTINTDKQLENENTRPLLKVIGGSRSDSFNHNLIDQVLQSCWYSQADRLIQDKKRRALLVALAGIGPSDEVEGMLAAQMVACHDATIGILPASGAPRANPRAAP